MTNRFLCIHAHFYQPPRENPWLEDVELQDSAHPYHDWNERITAECYAPNTASRILDSKNRIIDIVNNYTKISFNVGPTLLSWMEKHQPEVYNAILQADIEGRKRYSGHGPAIAQAYNHMIMPLANKRDKHTQVIWGITDFEHRFKRKPEGMWLPETAVDLETLDIMAENGIKFSILTPYQAGQVRKIGEDGWVNVAGGGINTKMPYLCKLPSGKTINLFFYDGAISQEVAFAGLLNNGEAFANRLLSAFSEDTGEPQLVNIATDGETYGHHHRYGDMALAFSSYHLKTNNLAEITIYGEYLERHPSTYEVEIIENSSWSCAHGIERWRGDCGCNTGGPRGWNQAWRKPLRESMDWLRDKVEPLYEKELVGYVKDPWQARDEYIEVILDRSSKNIEDFLSWHAIRELAGEEKVKTLKLLELQRNAMLMFTSCGWFFNDISGIETVQIMQYAARTLQIAKEVGGIDLEPAYLEIIEQAFSNLSVRGNGALIYKKFVKPAMLDLPRVAAHYAVSSLFDGHTETTNIYCYTAKSEVYNRLEAGNQKLATGKVRIRSDITMEENDLVFTVLYLGDHNLNGGVREFMTNEAYDEMHVEMEKAFLKNNIPEIIRLTDKHFGTHNYSLWHLFKEEQRKVFDQILRSTIKEIEAAFRQTYEHHYPVMRMMNEMNMPLPKAFTSIVEFIFNTDLHNLMENDKFDNDRLRRLIDDIKTWPCELDKATLNFDATRRIDSFIEKLSHNPEDLSLMKTLDELLRSLTELQIEPDMWKAQNIYFSIGKVSYNSMKERAGKADLPAKEWITLFDCLGQYLQVKME